MSASHGRRSDSQARSRAVTISLLILGIVVLALAPAAMGAAYAVARGEPHRANGWGLLVAVGLPLVSILVMVTVIGG